jgi:hypothetical protein
MRRGSACGARQQGVGAEADSIEVSGSVTRGRKKMTTTPTSRPGVAATWREERRAWRPVASAGPARYATRKRGWLAGFGPNEKRVAGWAKEGGEKAASIYLFLFNFSNCILK